VAVTNPGGTGSANAFTYYATPTVTSCSPNNGPISGGTAVTITGTNFVAPISSVTFGGVAATGVSVVNGTTITCTTPARAAGLVAVAVTNPGGTGSANAFTYTAASGNFFLLF
jgi:hypothetical protein